MPWQLGAVAVFSIVALGSATNAQGVTAVVLVSALGTAGMLIGAVQMMKLANRKAQRRIAAGEYPGIGLTLSSESDGQSLIEGPESLEEDSVDVR
jgi:uncharacterized protein HemX